MADPGAARVFDVVCPPGVSEGDAISISIETGESFELMLPANVSEGDSFQVSLPDQFPEPASGLRAIAKEIEEARNIAAEFFGGEANPVLGSEVLTAALRSILGAIEAEDEIDDLIDGHCEAFAEYEEGGEQALEWTELHQRYVSLVDAAIREHLDELECTDEEVFEYACNYGAADEATARLLSKFTALSDYARFCTMMHEAHERGGMSV
jgi:hypothetical protein